MKADLKDFYQILGLSRDASSDDVRKAYRIYAAKFHPDKHEGDAFFAERFKEVNEAHDTLIDPDKRWKYDIRKFRKSKVKPTADDFEGTRVANEELSVKGKLKVDVAHLDVYVAVFYFINLAAAIFIRNGAAATPRHIAILLFIGIASSLFIWVIANGIIEIGKGKRGSGLRLGGFFIAAMAAAYLCIWPPWG